MLHKNSVFNDEIEVLHQCQSIGCDFKGSTEELLSHRIQHNFYSVSEKRISVNRDQKPVKNVNQDIDLTHTEHESKEAIIVKTVPFVNLIPKFFQCKECGYPAISVQHFALHIETFHNQNILPCGMCDFESEDLSTFTKHQNEDHNSIYPCGRCKFIGISYYDIESHVSKMHQNAFELVFQFDYFSIFQRCPASKCRIGYNDIDKLRAHYRAMHECIKVYCKICGKEYENLGSLKVHIDRHKKDWESKVIHCKDCNFVTRFKECLDVHIDSLHKKMIIRQSKDYYYKKLIKEQRNKTKEKPTNSKKVQITITNESLENYNLEYVGINLDNASTNISEDDVPAQIGNPESIKYPCMVCEKDFENISGLIDHMEKQHYLFSKE